MSSGGVPPHIVQRQSSLWIFFNTRIDPLKGIATRNKKLLGAPGIATRSKDATSNKN